MKYLIFAWTFSLSFAAAAAGQVRLDDPAILGGYKLAKPDRRAELQTAEVVYNADKELVVRTNRSDTEYALSGPKAGGLVYDGTDEPNCDGDEEHCYYDAETQIWLTLVDGRPQLKIEIVVSDAWDDTRKSDTTITSVLNWSKSLPYAIPFYTNAEVPADLQNLNQACKVKLRDLEYDSVVGYLNQNAICPHAASFQYREPFADAFEAFKKDWVGKKDKVNELSKAEIRQLFDQARNLARKYKGKSGRVSPAVIVEQINDVEAYVLKADRVFWYPSVRDAAFLIVDHESKLITQFDIQITNRYEH